MTCRPHFLSFLLNPALSRNYNNKTHVDDLCVVLLTSIYLFCVLVSRRAFAIMPFKLVVVPMAADGSLRLTVTGPYYTLHIPISG